MEASFFQEAHVLIGIVTKKLGLWQCRNVEPWESFDECFPQSSEVLERPHNLVLALAVEAFDLELYDSVGLDWLAHEYVQDRIIFRELGCERLLVDHTVVLIDLSFSRRYDELVDCFLVCELDKLVAWKLRLLLAVVVALLASRVRIRMHWRELRLALLFGFFSDEGGGVALFAVLLFDGVNVVPSRTRCFLLDLALLFVGRCVCNRVVLGVRAHSNHH